MADEKKPPMPRQPTTVKLEAAPPWAVAIKQQHEARFGALEQDVEQLEQREAATEGRVEQLEQREKGRSVRVGENSQNDMKQDAAIANILTDVANVKSLQEKHSAKLETLERKADTNTETLAVIEKAATGWLKEHPAVGAALAGLIVAILTAITQWIARGGQ